MSFGHDVRRHSQQHADVVSAAQTAEEVNDAKYERRQWKQATFWSLWRQSSLRAVGFLVQEACCK